MSIFLGGSSVPHQPPVCWVCSQPISGVFLQAKGKKTKIYGRCAIKGLEYLILNKYVSAQR